VLDNLSVHRTAPARAVIEAAGCHLRFLPAYSPDFNPIELAFAKLKTHLRGVASRAYDTLVTAIGDGFDRITAADAVAWYRHCGYHVPDPSPLQPL
jgi:transposase